MTTRMITTSIAGTSARNAAAQRQKETTRGNFKFKRELNPNNNSFNFNLKLT
jgi:hypothetical protein